MDVIALRALLAFDMRHPSLKTDVCVFDYNRPTTHAFRIDARDYLSSSQQIGASAII